MSFFSRFSRHTNTRTYAPKIDPVSTFINGLNAFKSLDFERAFPLLRSAALANHPEAVYYTGLCHLEGKGTKPDFTKAFRYFENSYYNGHPEGTYRLGQCYLEGKGTKSNPEKAIALFKLSADLGCDDGLIAYSKALLEGTGILQNQGKAFLLLKRTADRGNPDALALVGACYFEGIGIKADRKEGMKYLKLAERMGCQKESIQLGVCLYQAGEIDEANKVIFPITQYKCGLDKLQAFLICYPEVTESVLDYCFDSRPDYLLESFKTDGFKEFFTFVLLLDQKSHYFQILDFNNTNNQIYCLREILVNHSPIRHHEGIKNFLNKPISEPIQTILIDAIKRWASLHRYLANNDTIEALCTNKSYQILHAITDLGISPDLEIVISKLAPYFKTPSAILLDYFTSTETQSDELLPRIPYSLACALPIPLAYKYFCLPELALNADPDDVLRLVIYLIKDYQEDYNFWLILLQIITEKKHTKILYYEHDEIINMRFVGIIFKIANLVTNPDNYILVLQALTKLLKNDTSGNDEYIPNLFDSLLNGDLQNTQMPFTNVLSNALTELQKEYFDSYETHFKLPPLEAFSKTFNVLENDLEKCFTTDDFPHAKLDRNLDSEVLNSLTQIVLNYFIKPDSNIAGIAFAFPPIQASTKRDFFQKIFEGVVVQNEQEHALECLCLLIILDFFDRNNLVHILICATEAFNRHGMFAESYRKLILCILTHMEDDAYNLDSEIVPKIISKQLAENREYRMTLLYILRNSKTKLKIKINSVLDEIGLFSNIEAMSADAQEHEWDEHMSWEEDLLAKNKAGIIETVKRLNSLYWPLNERTLNIIHGKIILIMDAIANIGKLVRKKKGK